MGEGCLIVIIDYLEERAPAIQNMIIAAFTRTSYEPLAFTSCNAEQITQTNQG